LAANYIKLTGVRINGIKTQKPSALIEMGDVIIFFVMDELKVIKTLTLGSRRGSFLEASELFEDRSK
jgi:ribosomal 50S subunit-recycling heat shock protein